MAGAVESKFECISLLPLDNYEDSTVPATAWITLEDGSVSGARLAEFATACFLLARHEGGPCVCCLCEPRVAYNPKSDKHFFIFKTTRGGYTFLVGEGVSEMGLEQSTGGDA